MKSLVFIILSTFLLVGCHQQPPTTPVTNESPKRIDAFLKHTFENFEKESLQVYPETSERLLTVAKRLEPRGLTKDEQAFLEMAAGDDNPHKALFAVQLLADHESGGEVLEERSLSFLKSEDPELQWHGTWNLFRKQSRIGPLSTVTLDGLADLLKQLLESESDNRETHIQLILRTLEESQDNPEVAAKVITIHFGQISTLLKKSGFESNAPIVRSVLSLLSRAPANLREQALSQIATIEAGEPDFFKEEIKLARTALQSGR